MSTTKCYSVWAAKVAALLAAGYTCADAETWATEWWCRDEPDLVVEQANAFGDLGVPVVEAIEWHTCGFYADQVADLRRMGWTPSDAIVLCTMEADEVDDWLTLAHDHKFTPHEIVTWVCSGVPSADAPEWAKAATEHGLTTDQAVAYAKAGLRPGEVGLIMTVSHGHAVIQALTALLAPTGQPRRTR